MMDLSIIVVCYKGWNRLNKCLEALDSFQGNNFNTEVIVVDNRSDDNEIYKIENRFPKFHFIYNEINGGFANGCNLGSKNATGEYFLFLNPDTIVLEEELKKLLKAAKQNPSYKILSCYQVNEKGKMSISSGEFPRLNNLTGLQRAIFRNRIPVTGNRVPEISFPDWISGSVVLIHKGIFNKLGGFDEDFWMYFEDVDLCRRVRNNGGEIAFLRDISVEHNHGGSSRIDLKTASLTKTEVYISRHVYISKHKHGFDRLLIQTFLVINNLITSGLMALIGLIFFFVPKLFARALIFLRLISYYSGALFRQSWISTRSVNNNKKQDRFHSL
jgi:GT2 family glycosyltransferase